MTTGDDKSRDHAARIAVLEAWSKSQHNTIEELKRDTRCIRTGVESISRDLAAAKMGGRVIWALCLALGAAISWTISLFTR